MMKGLLLVLGLISALLSSIVQATTIYDTASYESPQKDITEQWLCGAFNSFPAKIMDLEACRDQGKNSINLWGDSWANVLQIQVHPMKSFGIALLHGQMGRGSMTKKSVTHSNKKIYQKAHAP
ncbi:hypothetical protein EXU30_00275 [Shewanella maritima]|uniref:Uncharacterized protein n=1 Tax=Shewanella maritima TaxID=2520507 RepID=A0A411PCL7_9GAMM|nr:hypothetical protein [Shewanella maritima]QBF81305.1 hypothetical protein EXU30_00275 [Shewanella maritima]